MPKAAGRPRLLKPKSVTCLKPQPTKREKQLKELGVVKETPKQVVVSPIDESYKYFADNPNLGPPYHLLLDTNFIQFSIGKKVDIFEGAMRCLLAKVIPCITDCVMAELELLGKKFQMALKIARDPRFKRLTCDHKGHYGDDCIVQRVTAHRIYIVCTCDKDLKRRLRKIPGVPLMTVGNHKFDIEKLPRRL
ncbi:hypothetical protein, conserved [Entamoeba dispar SAW760]|uniref:PIN domain-containing protein n=1 Tax=Entamoeba dispar (strain ATCC PRA-260 / SAW760) TaxID=370354 RepID=B0EN37_ENTDS|nr:uncharacterized protein EDI_035200 [Entamoeba dispar SAW760]EDR24062.1 hypothetical protein, conserved [Entamoeba dispar SAW760]|eukprot:EDR24062.1 hypothetical protein, conserved [Entamoeba dispar SAW760]